MLATNVGPSRVTIQPLTSPRLRIHKAVRRVLFFGKNMSRTRCTGALVDGLLQHGLKVKWQNYSTVRRWLPNRSLAHAWVRQTFRQFRPDMIMVFCRDLPQTLLEEFRAHVPTVLWVEEALHDLEPAHLDYMRSADLVCVSNPSRIGYLQEQGVENVEFLMSGFSPRFHHPSAEDVEFERDVVFIGGPGVRGQRAEFLARVSQHYQTDIYGLGWEDWLPRFKGLRVHPPVKAPGFRELCATSRIVLGLNQVNNDALYFSNRTWLSLACGAFHLTHYVPGLETVVEDGQHLVWYEDFDECLEKIGTYLADPRARARIAEAGCRLAHEHHQYFHRISRILEIVRGDTSQPYQLPQPHHNQPYQLPQPYELPGALANGNGGAHANGNGNGSGNGNGHARTNGTSPRLST